MPLHLYGEDKETGLLVAPDVHTGFYMSLWASWPLTKKFNMATPRWYQPDWFKLKQPIIGGN